eukprot:260191-Amphidinium_carterae.1
MPEHAINLPIHTRWNTQSGGDTYNPELPMYLLCWRQTMPYILRESHDWAQSHSNVYDRRAEDISIEFNSLYNGTTPRDISIKQLMGPTTGTWELAGWSKADNGGNGTFWFDHSILTWMTTSTQWHMNASSAITMLNAKSMTVAFRQWCEDNGLTTIPAKFLENDGKTIKPQYVTAESGMEHDHNAAMSLHKWHNEKSHNHELTGDNEHRGCQWRLDRQ